jgi:hypothetical protein
MINLKEYLGRDIPTEAIAELKARHGHTAVQIGGVRRDAIWPSELAERVGEARLVKGVSCTFEVQDGRTPAWDAVTGEWIGYTVHSEVFRAIVPESRAGGEGDYCGYCGAFNGPAGELRVGFDCHYCGSN